MTPVPFTAEYTKPAHYIETNCKLSEAFDATMDPNGEHPQISLGQTRVLHTDGESICNYYVVNLLLPNKIEVKMLVVNEGKMKDTDILIGMDIITMCDFAITGAAAEKQKFSFQTPGVCDIDFAVISKKQ